MSLFAGSLRQSSASFRWMSQPSILPTLLTFRSEMRSRSMGRQARTPCQLTPWLAVSVPLLQICFVPSVSGFHDSIFRDKPTSAHGLLVLDVSARWIYTSFGIAFPIFIDASGLRAKTLLSQIYR